MVLVDTSVWIDYLRGARTVGVRKLDELLARDDTFGITSPAGVMVTSRRGTGGPGRAT